jgi:hypothetical protein
VSSISGVQQQALNAAFSFFQPIDQQLWLGPLLLQDIEVHDVLGSVLELAKLLLQTRISSKQTQKHARLPVAAR